MSNKGNRRIEIIMSEVIEIIMSRGCIQKFLDFHVTISKKKMLVMLSNTL